MSYSTPYEAHLKHRRVAFVKQEKNAVKSQKMHFQNPQKVACSGHSIAIHSISMAGYVTAVLTFVHAKLCAREASSILKMTSCNFTAFYSFLTKANTCF